MTCCLFCQFLLFLTFSFSARVCEGETQADGYYPCLERQQMVRKRRDERNGTEMSGVDERDGDGQWAELILTRK